MRTAIRLFFSEQEEIVVHKAQENCVWVGNPQGGFLAKADEVFIGKSAERVYEYFGKLFNRAFQGVNCCFFHLRKGTEGVFEEFDIEDQSPVEKIVGDLIRQSGLKQFNSFCSCVEIDQKNIKDLLVDANRVGDLKLRDSRDLGLIVENLTEFPVESPNDFNFLLKRVNKHKKKGGKSHIVVQIALQSKKSYRNKSKLILCELSQNLDSFSVRVLCKTLNSLQAKKPWINYKQSLLTYFLKDNLNLQCSIGVLASISSSQNSLKDTLKSLKILQKFRNLKLTPKTNLNWKNQALSRPATSFDYNHKRNTSISQISNLMKKNEQLRKEFEQLTGSPCPGELFAPKKGESFQYPRQSFFIRRKISPPYYRKRSPQKTRALIMAYREKKLQKQIQLMKLEQEKQNIRKKRSKSKEIRRQKYFFKQRKKIEEYKASINTKNPSQPLPKKRIRKRVVSLNQVHKITKQSFARIEGPQYTEQVPSKSFNLDIQTSFNSIS